MTDRTPHESLPLDETTYRQFFRLVTSQVSLWYEDHSTPDPNGVKPDPSVTSIVRGDKFGIEGINDENVQSQNDSFFFVHLQECLN